MNKTNITLHFELIYSTQLGEDIFIHFAPASLSQKNHSTRMKLSYINSQSWELIYSTNQDYILNQICSYYYTIENNNELKFKSSNYLFCFTKELFANKQFEIKDSWIAENDFNLFYNQPCFTQILLPPAQNKNKPLSKNANCLFYIKDYLLKPEQKIAIIGNHPELNNWDLNKTPCYLQYNADLQMYQIQLQLPLYKKIEYKYIIINNDTSFEANFEDGENRSIIIENNALQVFHDGFIRKSDHKFRGVGVAIPIFSLRSKNSGGIGEFNDLKIFADWGKSVGLKMIQILPINDTSALFNWKDSYPYSAISIFALHPIYLHLNTLFSNKLTTLKKSYIQETQQLNLLEDVQYEKVLSIKWKYLTKIYNDQKPSLEKDPEFEHFLKENMNWIAGYCYFCYYRDLYHTANWQSWPEKSRKKIVTSTLFYDELFKNDDVTIHAVVQYWLHLQLFTSSQYIIKLGLLLKGDLAIGVAYNSSDVWQNPNLFKLQFQAGAPPDDFTEYGQNWGFPTYNWDELKNTNYQWWKNRFEKMQTYFQAFRIDHILGFFRIWSIPKNEIQGLLGYFDPTIPIQIQEIHNNGIYVPIERLTMPFINDDVLFQLFQHDVAFVKNTFLNYINYSNSYCFKENFNGQKAILKFLETEYPLYFENNEFISKIMSLYANKILLISDKKDEFHFRFFMQKTFSYKYLPQDQQEKLLSLYNNYFFTRSENLWEQNARKKLPALKAATNMLICGEDLGLVPQCVPKLMKELHILSLEVQRMPNNNSLQFNSPEQSPYLCVVTPSSHDTSTLRGWWQEQPPYLVSFYYDYLKLSGNFPVDATEEVIIKIIEKHLQAPAMWSVFQLQDILAIDSSLCLMPPQSERINIPAIAEHYWKYRMPMFIENLLLHESLNSTFKLLLQQSQRI